MKIAHIVCTYPPYYAGMGNTAFYMAQGLAERGHDVTVFTPSYAAKNEIADSDEQVDPSDQTLEALHTIQRLTPQVSYGNAARLPQLLDELNDFDIVHLHYPFFGTAGIVAKWKKKNPGKKLVMTYHMDPRSPGWKGIVFALYAKFWMNKILNAADLLIASSIDYLHASEAVGHYTKNKKKWRALPFGVDIQRFSKEGDIANIDAVGEEDQVALFVGGMDAAHHFKGIDLLLQAIFLLKEQGVIVQGVFVGDGELRVTYEQHAKGLGIHNQVHFVRRVSEEELPAYYRRAQVFVLPSIHKGEAFGMVLLEAMASGVSVIASDLPGVRTVAGKGGVVVPPNDARQLAIALGEFFTLEKKQQDTLGSSARKIVEQEFSWEGHTKTLEQWYEELLRQDS